MANTPNRGYPRPVNADPATIVTDLKESLEAVDQDVQTLSDLMPGKVTGQGAARLWLGTYTEYDAIPVIDPETVYIIRGGERSNPGKQWGLGVPRITLPSTDGVASYSVPDLPALETEWGYLAIIAGQNPVLNTWWNAPDGWTRIADQAETETTVGQRPVGIFKAPAGTPTGIFNIPGHGQGRHIAMVFPTMTEPSNEGMVKATTSGATFTMPTQVFTNPAVPITIASTHYTTLPTAGKPTMTGASFNTSNPTTIVIGQGASVLHLYIAESSVSYAGEETRTISRTPSGLFSAYRIGVGTA